jgi:hypothetical protein
MVNLHNFYVLPSSNQDGYAQCKYIIIDEADKMGLAQFYHCEAGWAVPAGGYAYLTYLPNKSMNETAQKRSMPSGNSMNWDPV